MARIDQTCKTSYTVEDYNDGLKGYKKNTKGIDKWTATELRELPIEGKTLLAAATELSWKKLAQPVQNPINLNPILGFFRILFLFFLHI